MRDPLDNPQEAIRRVYAYVAYRIGAGADAEDVTSATIERAIRYRSSYRREHGSPAAWLIGIAKRCIADAYASRAAAETDASDHAATVADPAGATVARLDLHRAVETLDDRARELVALRYGADLSSKDIAVVLDMTPGAVDVALHRALAHLRTRLSDAAPTPRSRARTAAETVKARV